MSGLGSGAHLKRRIAMGQETPFDIRIRESLEQTPTVTRCLFCSWKHVGTAIRGRQLAARHRARKHAA